jgi:hypothetical protein
MKGSRLAARALRDAARINGIARYFTGEPCKLGHIADRLVSNSTCVECMYARARDNPEWFRKHDHKRQQRPERRAQKAASERKCRKAEHRKAGRAAERRARQAAQLQRTPKWADLKAIRKFYDEMHRLTRETGIQHHVDHVLPLCGMNISGLHVAENLRVLPGPENLAKGSKFMS